MFRIPRSVSRRSLVCACCRLTALWIITVSCATATAESAITRSVRRQLEQRVSERDVAAAEKLSQSQAAADMKQEIDRLTASLESARNQLNQHLIAEQQAGHAEVVLTEEVSRLTATLEQHRQRDALQEAAALVRSRLEDRQAQLDREREELTALREQATAAGVSAGVARQQAIMLEMQVADLKPELEQQQEQVHESGIVLEETRVLSMQTSRELAEQQRLLSQATLDVRRAHKTSQRLAGTSEAIRESIRVLRPDSPLFAGSTNKETVLLEGILKSTIDLQSRAEQTAVRKEMLLISRREYLTAAAVAHEAAETEWRRKADAHSRLNQQHFVLQRTVDRLLASSRQFRDTSDRNLAEQERLTLEAAQKESAIDRLAAGIDSLQTAWLEAQRRADVAAGRLAVATTSEES